MKGYINQKTGTFGGIRKKKGGKMSLYGKTASEIAEMIKNKEVTSEEVTREFLQRIDSLEDKIGAFSSVLNEKSLESAKKYDNDNNEDKRKDYNSTLLFGVPVTLKDNILSKGDLTTASSQILKNCTSSSVLFLPYIMYLGC